MLGLRWEHGLFSALFQGFCLHTWHPKSNFYFQQKVTIMIQASFLHLVPKWTTQCSNNFLQGSVDILLALRSSLWFTGILNSNDVKPCRTYATRKICNKLFKHKNTSAESCIFCPPFILLLSFLVVLPTVDSEWVDREARRMGLGREKQRSWRKGRKATLQ